MLEIKNLSYVTPEGKVILDDINLSVSHKFVAITGPNGSGKSTLAKIIAGIITPTEGTILLDGTDISGMSVTERARSGVSFGGSYLSIDNSYYRYVGFSVRLARVAEN